MPSSDELTKILSQLPDLSLQEAVNKIIAVLPGDTKFLSLKAQLNKMEAEKQGGRISPTDYDVSLENKRESLNFFLEKLQGKDLKKVYETFFPSSTVSMPNKKVFISYRREDSSGYALALYNELCKWYNKDTIFKDFHSIEPGADFENEIGKALDDCAILLVIISDRWLEILKLRSNDLTQKDFVKLEITTTLLKTIYTIPITINKAVMPSETDLPDELKKLSKRQFLNIDQTRFETDVIQLVRFMDRKLDVKRDFY